MGSLSRNRHTGPMNRISPYLPNSIAVLLGIAMPALILGRAVFAVILGLSLILILIDMPCRLIWQKICLQARRPIGLLLLFIFILSIPSLFASDFPLRSFQAIARTLAFCGFGVIIWAYLKARPALASLWIHSLVVSAAIALCFALYSQYVSPSAYWFLHLKGWRTDPLYSTLKGYSAITVFLIPLLIYAAINKRGHLAIIALPVALGFLFLDWQLSSRAAIAGLLGAIICVAIAIGARVGSKIQVLLTVSISVASFGVILWWLRMTRGVFLSAAPKGDYFLPVWLIDFERQTIWSHALDIALRAPWFGRGANTINFAPGADKLLKGTHGLHVIPAHPHNWPLELFAETGAICLSVLVVFLMAWAFQLFLAYRRQGEAFMLCAIAIFAGYWSSGLFNFSFWSSWWQLAFILSMALSLSMVGESKIKDPQA